MRGGGDKGETGALVALRAPSLEPLAFALIPTKLGLGNVDDREHAPFVAFDPSGFLYADSDGQLGLSGLPLFPVVLGPGGSAFGSTLAYQPVRSGPALGTIEFVSDDLDDALVVVNVGGEDIGFADRAEELLAGVESAVAAGELVGNGPGASAPGRLGALIHMLEAAAEDIGAACEQLLDAQDRADGKKRPPDFVSGPAREELGDEIAALRMRLCSQ